MSARPAYPIAAAVLGAGGGIGAACCRALAEAGFRVAAADVDKRKAEAAVAHLPHAPCAFGCDVVDDTSVAAFAEQAAALGTIRALVYAPGLTMTASIEHTDWRRYRAVMAVNLDGAFHACAAFVPMIKRHGEGGAIVLIASVAGRRGEAGASHYCASKFGVIGLVESLAAELADSSIRVNAVCPGNVDTPMLREIAEQIAERESRPADEVWANFHRVGAARRLVSTREVANVCAALCGGAFSAVTGASLMVDAGAMVG